MIMGEMTAARRFAESTAVARPLALPGRAATLSVGAAQPYVSPCAAIAAAQPGDTIEIEPGASWVDDVCVISKGDLTIRSAGGKRARIGASGLKPLAHGKAIWVVAARGLTIDGLEFHGAARPAAAPAARRYTSSQASELPFATATSTTTTRASRLRTPRRPKS